MRIVIDMAADTGKDYLAEYDTAKEDEKFPLVRKWMAEEPLPFFKQLRAQRPILVTPECTLIAGFNDVRDTMSMPKIFTMDLYKPKMGVTEDDPGYLMAHDDDALHYREKSLMMGMLNRDDIPDVRKLIAEQAKKVLDNAQGEIEIVYNFCRWIPATMVEKYFGLDGVDKKELIDWSYWNQYDAFQNQPFNLNTQEKFQHIVDEHTRVSKDLVAYIAKLMVKKLALVKVEQTKNFLLAGYYLLKGVLKKLLGIKSDALDDTMVMRMLRTHYAKEVDFNLIRVGVNAGGLLIGAIETSSQAVSQAIKFFIDRPELHAMAKDAASLDNPEKFDSMVWEALRYVPIGPYIFRKLSEDYTLAKGTDYETKLPAGENVLLLTQSAMFDENAYDNPDEFDPERNWYHHFNFGFGAHECLGKYVGMVMLPEMVRQVMLRNNLTATTQMDYKNTPFPESYTLKWSD